MEIFRSLRDHFPSRRQLVRGLPGYLAALLMISVTALWVFWSFGELYWEGWWGPWYIRLAYLIPGGACLLLTLVAFKWPRLGGWLIILIGGAFTIWWSNGELRRLIQLFPVSGMLVVIGVLFLLEGRHRRLLRQSGWVPSDLWLLRNARYILAIGLPALIAIGWSVYWLPIVLTRFDDGDRGARLIKGNALELVWAPEGPGWNWKQEWGGYPSWSRLALYGMPPLGFEDKPGLATPDATGADMTATGLCRYLSADGTTLKAQPQNVWRMPTIEEIIRSLTRDGENAGCVPQAADDSGRRRSDCSRAADKETPLWAPDQSPIYYWAAEEHDAERAYYVGYNGAVNHQPKSWGNPRHSHRCVKAP
jgi:hypothetical protein